MASKVTYAEQRHATWALKAVEKIGKGGADKDFLADVRKLPSHIQNSGLAQTLLFYWRNSKELAASFASHLGLGESVDQAIKNLLASPATFQSKTREALVAAQWLKRVTEAMSKSRETSAERNEGGRS